MVCFVGLILSVRQTSLASSSSAIVSTTRFSNLNQPHFIRLLLRRLTCDVVVDSAVMLFELLLCILAKCHAHLILLL